MNFPVVMKLMVLQEMLTTLIAFDECLGMRLPLMLVEICLVRECPGTQTAIERLFPLQWSLRFSILSL